MCGGVTSLCVYVVLAGFFFLGISSATSSENAVYQTYELPITNMTEIGPIRFLSERKFENMTLEESDDKTAEGDTEKGEDNSKDTDNQKEKDTDEEEAKNDEENGEENGGGSDRTNETAIGNETVSMGILPLI